ncbi:hypothetical protein KIH74_01030 [Kineosporia sp. J2-2]|uniref:Uncharacterized protein n=1 Tax=Kineosporia corallincola TaxID=2835133 RepID=A0ABS5T8T7_9ACTN|nr:hypothetical protein [Kineosporia corallincola]MBT0767485.1 hypothetical protein [Kineosporia corallincola]
MSPRLHVDTEELHRPAGHHRPVAAEASTVPARFPEAVDPQSLSARSRLIGRSTARSAPGHQAWRGPDGLRLSPRASAAVEAFSALTAAGEPTLTAAVREVARAGSAELTGLAHRLKDGESIRRKLATQQANTGRALPALLHRTEDAVRYTMVLADESYAAGVARVTALFEQRGYHRLSLNDTWRSQRYRGINTTWADPATGIAFEVQFHTPATWRVTRDTHPLYEEFRRIGTPAQRRAELSRRIGAAYRAVPMPAGVDPVGVDSVETAPVPGDGRAAGRHSRLA